MMVYRENDKPDTGPWERLGDELRALGVSEETLKDLRYYLYHNAEVHAYATLAARGDVTPTGALAELVLSLAGALSDSRQAMTALLEEGYIVDKPCR